ncbi:hypothetical protein T261_01716 [Streptomyces lydicus]|nr:hypothetical protein T261_01716 [Streptomyces lydicus]
MTVGRTWGTDALEVWYPLRSIAPPDWCHDKGEQTSAALTGQMNLAGQPTTGAPQGLI